MTKDKALRLALEALTNAYWPTESDLMPAHNIKECAEAITAIKEALAQPEQPKVRTGDCLLVGVCASEGHKIQPQRTWVELTLGEQGDLYSEYSENPALLYRAIEAKLKEKNVPKD
jgi:hypothetical protein